MRHRLVLERGRRSDLLDRGVRVKCWICSQNEAISGEHRVKSSDIKAVLGTPTQQAPFRMHDDVRRNIPVGSLKADRLKLPGRICEPCNTTRSQPYDRAWEALSEVLRRRARSIREGVTVRAKGVFPADTQRQLLNVHLYFVKLFGCHIAGNAIPIPLDRFARALISGTAHPNVYLRFGTMRGQDHVGMTDMRLALFAGGGPAFATWFYEIGPISVNVMFAAPGERRRGLIDSWHPAHNTDKLIMADFNDAAEALGAG